MAEPEAKQNSYSSGDPSQVQETKGCRVSGTSANSLSNLLMIVSFALFGFGTYAYNVHSDKYLSEITAVSNQSGEQAAEKQQSLEIRFEIERTKDFLTIGGGALAGLLAAATRKD